MKVTELKKELKYQGRDEVVENELCAYSNNLCKEFGIYPIC